MSFLGLVDCEHIVKSALEGVVVGGSGRLVIGGSLVIGGGFGHGKLLYGVDKGGLLYGVDKGGLLYGVDKGGLLYKR